MARPEIDDAIRSVANSITPLSALAGSDEHGGSIASLTEAVLSVSNSLCSIARAIEGLADAVSDIPIPE